MDNKNFTWYWVLAEDELSPIGSGFRRLQVQTGRKWAYVKDPETGLRHKLPLAMWEKQVPHIEDHQHLTFGAILKALR